MRDDEQLLTASASINVSVSEMFGRGAGDGTLGVTNQRIIHIGSRVGTIGIERNEIVSASKKWIVIPGSSQLDISARKVGQKQVTFSFYCGTGFCKDVVRELAR
jgi:hypothetical protein